jgi:hypothetical protein
MRYNVECACGLRGIIVEGRGPADYEVEYEQCPRCGTSHRVTGRMIRGVEWYDENDQKFSDATSGPFGVP